MDYLLYHQYEMQDDVSRVQGQCEERDVNTWDIPETKVGNIKKAWRFFFFLLKLLSTKLCKISISILATPLPPPHFKIFRIGSVSLPFLRIPTYFSQIEISNIYEKYFTRPTQNDEHFYRFENPGWESWLAEYYLNTNWYVTKFKSNEFMITECMPTRTKWKVRIMASYSTTALTALVFSVFVGETN